MRLLGVLLAFFVVGSSRLAFAQGGDKQISERQAFSGYVKFDAGIEPSFSDWQNVLRRELRLDEQTEWRIYSELSDELGQVHFRAQQYFQGIPVEFGVVVLHTRDGKLLSFNGEVIPISRFSGTTGVTQDDALGRVLAEFPAEKYYWQDETQNVLLREVTGNPDTSYFPSPVVVYCAKNLNFKEAHRLCYKFPIYASQPLLGKMVYIDAENLEIMGAEDLILHTDVKGTAVTAYSGTRPITTDSTAPGNYRLREKARGKGVETYNMKNGTSYGAAVDFTDANNVWNNVNLSKDEFATDAHWGAEKTYDFFDTIFGRKSFDNNNARIISYVHYSSNYSNAFWNGSYMTYGDGNGSTWKPLTSLDVCGHEIAHAVTTYTAGLIYSYESGALNESFSDIFGNAIEIWARPKKHNWKMGEDFTTSGAGIRDMSNPNPYGHPKYYKGVSWYAGPGDNGGVHTNSGVQNYWFYLITEGVSGTNEKGNVFDIDSLGVIDASKIAYRNLSVYLTKNSQYEDARIYSIISAADLFGNCGKHAIAVTNAWWVCGVGSKYDSGYVKADFLADTLLCSTAKSAVFNNRSQNAVSYKWYFGDGNTSTLFNPVHNYTQYGKFDIKLVAKSCFKNKYDSLTKVAYVNVDSTYDICNAVLMPKSGTDTVVKCFGFIYDDGGEGEYGDLRQTNLKVNIPGANSIRFRFLVMDYELGYDSIVLFKNTTSQSNKIGRFTGQTLPYGGAWQTVTSANSLWLRHYSDPFVEGKGFKIQFEGIRDPVLVDIGADTTICFGDSLKITPKVSGGYPSDHRYLWYTGSTQSVLRAKPLATTKIKLTIRDVCTNVLYKDSAMVFVKKPLEISLGNNTVICAGNSVRLQATASGGIVAAYNYSWSHGLGNSASHILIPPSTTTYRVILNDGCTDAPDTAYQTITVKPKLQISVSATDSVVCIGKSTNLIAKVSGGDTSGYVVTWNNGLGSGFNKSLVLTDTGLFIATLSDGCSVASAKDSIYIYTYPALALQLRADTILCRGTSIDITALASGGKGNGYNLTWSHGKTGASISETPVKSDYYTVNLSDGCSPDAKDSVLVDLYGPLQLQKIADTLLCDGQTLPVNFVPTGGRASSYAIAWNQHLTGFSVNLDPPTGTTKYRAILSDGCTLQQDTTTFEIQKLAPLNADILLTPGSICKGESVKMDFVFSGGKPASYIWKLDGAQAFFMTQNVQLSKDATFALELSDGCSKIATANASVKVHDQPAATLTADQLLVCAGAPVRFAVNSPDAASVKWFFSNGDSADGNTVFKSFAAGNYTATARVKTSFNCMATFVLTDTIKTIAYPKAAFHAKPEITNIEYPDFQFENFSTGATDHFWSFGDGNYGTGNGTVNHSYDDTGWFRVMLRVSVAPGCADSAIRMVRVKDVYKLFRPNSFTPNNDRVNDKFVPMGRGIDKYNIRIYNRWGMKVFESDNMGVNWDGRDANGEQWPPDKYAYVIKILDTDGVEHEERGVIVLYR
jgi:bacillolysin